MNKYLLILCASAFVFIGSYSTRSAYAGGSGENADLNIELEVKAGCTLDLSDSDIIFPEFYSLDRALSEVGKLQLKCTRGNQNGSAVISLDGGMVCEGDKPNNRWLYHNGQCDTLKRMKLNIYQGVTGSTLWGDGADAYTVSIKEDGTDQEVDFRAELPQQLLTNLPTGEYSNKFRVSVVYPA